MFAHRPQTPLKKSWTHQNGILHRYFFYKQLACHFGRNSRETTAPRSDPTRTGQPTINPPGPSCRGVRVLQCSGGPGGGPSAGLRRERSADRGPSETWGRRRVRGGKKEIQKWSCRGTDERMTWFRGVDPRPLPCLPRV